VARYYVGLVVPVVAWHSLLFVALTRSPSGLAFVAHLGHPDLFLAPFLANLALIVDQTLSDDISSTDSSADGNADLIVNKDNYDSIFLATFGVLTMIGFLLSSCLLVAASVFKLANLGSFLPFPVICGFFAAVGIMTWTLAVNVDTGGKSVGVILTSGDMELWKFALVHHIPTLVVAGFMKYLGPKNPFFVVGVVFVTVGLFHIIMFFSGTPMEDMIEMGWFWSHDELVYTSSTVALGFDKWAPPAPFGVLAELRQVHWSAVQKGLSTAVALSFLYLIRCSVHGAALKKNIPNLARKVRSDDPALTSFSVGDDGALSPNHRTSHPKVRSRRFSEAVDIEAVMQPFNGNTQGGNGEAEQKPKYEILHAKPTNVSLKSISLTYGCSQLVSALVGGFAVTPAGTWILCRTPITRRAFFVKLTSLHPLFGLLTTRTLLFVVAASTTMFSLGAEGLGPQIGSVLLLLVFYLTDFQFVVFIPKPAFSSMLVLSSIDMMWNWFYKSYFKTKDKAEWIVVPAIVVVAFALDLLSAVFIGIAFSTFIFVAAFFRSGVVKYVATGQVIHSTIERTFRMSEWLNENGDLIGIMVLQNYLFFGNASSVFNYICSMFNDDKQQTSFERKPKYLILDLTLVTGMDTSTADVFQDIRNLCGSNKCKLLMAGMSPNVRSILALGGFKADAGVRSKRKLRFFQNLDAALGKAEDMLLDSDYDDKEHQAGLMDGRRRMRDRGNTGFRTALGHINAEVSC
jgi:MFS superfamily sulfate permease-like transporter